MNAALARRRFLLALGAGLMPHRALAELGGEVPSNTRGSAPTAKRFVAVYMPHGRAAELFYPRPGFRVDFEDAILAPFDDAARHGRSFREDLLVIDGIDLAAGFLTGNVGHDAPRVLLTGAGASGRNASLDQFLAVEHRLGEATPVPSLVLGVGNEERGPTSSISYGRGGVPLPKLIHPARTFDALFGAALTGSPQAAAARRARSESVLDFLGGDLKRLRARAPANEREKLEHHATALRDLERRLQPLDGTCAAPQRVADGAFPRYRAYGGGEPSFDAITDLQLELVARGFACSITRFASLMLADLSRTRVDPRLPDDVHQDVAHRYLASDGDRAGDPNSWRALARQNRYCCSKVARLYALLDQAGLSHDTIVLATSEMGDPARHSSRRVPTLLLGGGIKGGRVLGVPERERVTEHRLYPNNRLLCRLGQAFGVPLTRFGDTVPAIAEGVLEL